MLQHGGVVVNLDSLKVTIKDDTVSLGQTEFKLLQFMMGNPDRVFSREQLLDNVWGIDSDVEERTVDVHILRLRKALRAAGVTKLIETVRGAGYRISS